MLFSAFSAPPRSLRETVSAASAPSASAPSAPEAEQPHRVLPHGRIVVPLDLRGVQRSVAFERAGDHWTSRSAMPCGFMRMRGPFAGPERTYVLDSGISAMIGRPPPLRGQPQ